MPFLSGAGRPESTFLFILKIPHFLLLVHVARHLQYRWCSLISFVELNTTLSHLDSYLFHWQPADWESPFCTLTSGVRWARCLVLPTVDMAVASVMEALLPAGVATEASFVIYAKDRSE